MRRLAYIAAVLPAIVIGAAATAAAGEEVDHPDDHPHNYFAGNATTCEDAGLAGDLLYSTDEPVEGQDEIIEGTVYGDDDQFLDVVLLDESFTITGVVVKGGPGYTVYDEPPWTELHSPPLGWVPEADLALDAMTKPEVTYPQISHWYVCGEMAPPTEEPTPTPTPTVPPTEEPTEPPTEEPTEPPTEEPTEPPTEEPTTPPTDEPTDEPSESPSPSDTPSPSPTDDGELPDTGSSPTAMIAAALMLLVAGAVALRHRIVKA